MINIDEFLLPISEDNKCGENLKYDYIYDQIKEFRREDDPRLPQGIWQIEPKKANWPEVYRLCSDILKARTKDLQIAMWLLESLIVIEKFNGFNQGILLILALCENFWDEIYPTIDWKSDNLAARLSPFYFFSEKIQEKIVLIPIVESMDSLSGNYTLSDWMMARHNLQTKNNKELSLKQLNKSVLATPLEFFETLATDVESSMKNLRKLNDFILEKCKNESPSFRKIFDYLEDIKRITQKNIADKQFQISERSEKIISTNKEEDLNLTSERKEQSMEQGKVSIEQAYIAMEEIAAFLEQEQPQSPVSTLIKIAGVIGRKNFQELSEINIKSGDSVINTIFELHHLLVVPPENKQLIEK
ncbi:MAG: type VI secretion system protein TssA [Holosporaceae bacterium]|jgi:type VI secretion system ImpA family protein|nr:type VI secretion system protein TssA [Holosporaceae bacterium]